MTGLQDNGKSMVLTGAALKNVAYITMFVDHFFAVLFLGYMRLHTIDGKWDLQLEKVYRVGRAVGRVSFVLFAFLIVEGFVYTRSRTKYLARLFLFALLSEIPFDLAFSGELFDWGGQNIYWSLFTGVFVLCLWEYLSHYRNVFCAIGGVAVLIAGCAVALWLNMDYRMMGILLIFTLYRTRGRDMRLRFLAVGLVMFFGTWAGNCIRYAGQYTTAYLFAFSLREMYGLLAFLPIFLYNGEKGRQLPKPFYYAFYPVHLLVLYGIARATGIM